MGQGPRSGLSSGEPQGIQRTGRAEKGGERKKNKVIERVSKKKRNELPTGEGSARDKESPGKKLVGVWAKKWYQWANANIPQDYRGVSKTLRVRGTKHNCPYADGTPV